MVMLLQKAVQVQEVNPLADFTTGSKAIVGLLSAIIGLLLYIWNQSQKSTVERHQELKDMAEKRHSDVLQLYKTLDTRQHILESEHRDHKWELHAFRGYINKVQGKEFYFDNPRPDKPKA